MTIGEREKIEVIFDEVAKKVTSVKKDIASLKTVLDSFELQGKSVLEVGCGIGDNLIYCSQKGALYAEGFDISGESIKLAQQKTKRLSNIFFHKCSIEEYNSERNFDFILAWGVFEYVDNPIESLKKMLNFLSDNGTIILFISKPIFIKKISFLFRAVLSKLPADAVLPVARFLGRFLGRFKSILRRILYIGESNTYSMEQTILEGLMVPRYNIFHHRLFTDYLQNGNFTVEFLNGTTPSMIGMVASKKREKNAE